MYQEFYFVYVLQSQRDKSFYVGYAADVFERLLEHNNGETFSTRHNIPWTLIYFEAFRSKKDAMERERKLKHHGKGLQELKLRLKNSQI